MWCRDCLDSLSLSVAPPAHACSHYVYVCVATYWQNDRSEGNRENRWKLTADCALMLYLQPRARPELRTVIIHTRS